MKLEWTQQALHDIDEIMLFIAKDNIDRAISFTEELMDYPWLLITHPYLGVPYSDEYGDRIRMLIFKGYNMIYQVAEDSIIIHVVYNHSQTPPLMKIRRRQIVIR